MCYIYFYLKFFDIFLKEKVNLNFMNRFCSLNLHCIINDYIKKTTIQDCDHQVELKVRDIENW